MLFRGVELRSNETRVATEETGDTYHLVDFLIQPRPPSGTQYTLVAPEKKLGRTICLEGVSQTLTVS